MLAAGRELYWPALPAAGIISAPFYTTLVVAAVVTSQMAGAWLDYVLRKGWPLLSPAAMPEAAVAEEGLSAA